MRWVLDEDAVKVLACEIANQVDELHLDGIEWAPDAEFVRDALESTIKRALEDYMEEEKDDS